MTDVDLTPARIGPTSKLVSLYGHYQWRMDRAARMGDWAALHAVCDDAERDLGRRLVTPHDAVHAVIRLRASRSDLAMALGPLVNADHRPIPGLVDDLTCLLDTLGRVEPGVVRYFQRALVAQTNTAGWREVVTAGDELLKARHRAGAGRLSREASRWRMWRIDRVYRRAKNAEIQRFEQISGQAIRKARQRIRDQEEQLSASMRRRAA